ncbi:hypothetical protein PAMP_024139 [Pampus punctatissimus]
MAGDQRSAWPLTLAPSGPFRGPVRGVLLDVGGVGLWLCPSVAGPVPNRLKGQLKTSLHYPAAFERPGAERPGQDGVRLAAALCCLSNTVHTLLHSGQLCMLDLGQEVGLFVTSTCDPQPSMLCSPEGGQAGTGQAWAMTSG